MGRHLPQLDGLRAVAVLMVFGFHVFPDVIPGGYIGAICFSF
jgi:peptidoglycan/LPS O-acetylase OafA/YrhL